MSYLRMYPGPKEERENRKRERQDQKENTNVRQLPVPVSTSVSLPKEQQELLASEKQSRASLIARYCVVFVVTLCALCLVIAEIAMGVSLAYERANTDLELAIWLAFTIVPSLFTFLLPTIGKWSRSIVTWTVYVLLFLPLSLLSVHIWLDNHLTDKVVAKQEREIPEIRDTRDKIDRLKTSLNGLQIAMSIECQDRPNRPGSGNGTKCQEYRYDKIPKAETDIQEAEKKLTLLRREVREDSNNDATNASIAKLLSLLLSFFSTLQVGTDGVRSIVSLMLTITVPSSGLILMAAIKCLERR
jgi:hypothetical protein